MLTDNLYRWIRPLSPVHRKFKRLVSRLPHRRRLINHFGQQLWVDPAEMSGFYLYYEQDYDDYVFEFLSTQVSKYNRALDVGANIGIYTVFFAARFNHVDAFEPSPEVIPLLKANLELNAITNVDIHQLCLGQVSGTVNFVPAFDNNRGLGHITTETRGSIQVPCSSIDDFIMGPFDEPLLIKMDIEGAEWLALQGARRCLTERKSEVAILIEIHPEQIQELGGTVGGLHSLLEDFGLSIKGLTPFGLSPLRAADNYRFWWATSERI